MEQTLSANREGKQVGPIALDNEYLSEFVSLFTRIQESITSGTEEAYDIKSEEEFKMLRSEIEKIKDLHDKYLLLSRSMLSQIQSGDHSDHAIYGTAFMTLEDQLNLAFEATLFKIQSFTANSVEEIRQREKRVYTLYLVIGCLLLLFIFSFLVIIILKIRFSIQQAVKFAEDIESGNRQPTAITPGKDEIGRIVHAMQFMLESIRKAEDELKKIALTDSLTGIGNRLMFNTALGKEIERVKRYNQPLSLIMFDIDHFKQFNDTHGHDAGDAILIELTDLITKNIRTTDLFARWGGEEFMILCSSTGKKDAMVLAEKLRTVTDQHLFSGEQRVTCSFGLAQYQDEAIDTFFLKRVDSALYKAKKTGRNKVSVSGSPAT